MSNYIQPYLDMIEEEKRQKTVELRGLTLTNEFVRKALSIHEDLEIVDVKLRANGSIDFTTRPKAGKEFPTTLEDLLDEATDHLDRTY